MTKWNSKSSPFLWGIYSALLLLVSYYFLPIWLIAAFLLVGIGFVFMWKKWGKFLSFTEKKGLPFLLGFGDLIAIAGGIFLRYRIINENGRGGLYHRYFEVVQNGFYSNYIDNYQIHGIEDWYRRIYLYFCFPRGIIFHKPWFLVAFFIVAIVLLTVAMWRLYGSFQAFVVCLLFSISDWSVRMVSDCSSSNLYFLLFAICFFLISLCYPVRRLSVIWCVLSGLMIALISYMDLSGLCMLGFLPCIIFKKNPRKRNEEVDLSMMTVEEVIRKNEERKKIEREEGSTLLKLISFFGSFIACFLFIILQDASYSDCTFGEILFATFNQYGPFRFLWKIPVLFGENGIGSMIFFSLCIIGIPTGFALLRQNAFSLFALPGIPFLILFMNGMLYEYENPLFLVYFFLSAFVCVIFRFLNLSHQNASAENENSDAVIQDDARMQQIPAFPDTKGGTVGEIVTVSVNGEEKQIKLLDNPMQVPKKKDHSEIDYDIIPPDDADYDYDTPDDADYDI